jgi:histidine triad (HIT) family protein
MYNHAPADYLCPFCALASGALNDKIASVESDVFHRDRLVTAFISLHQWPRNPGHAIVIPSEHYENIFDLPLDLATRIHKLARSIALAMKAAYCCDGVSTRQHNEPAGNQDVWHYHLHVFPRYESDELYMSQPGLMPEWERGKFAQTLRSALVQ